MMQNMRTHIETSTDRRFAIDTTFVLFFLALDLGMSFTSAGIDSILSVVTVAAFVVLPYFLPENGEKPEFAVWAAGRTLIALFGTALGFAFRQGIGSALPEVFIYLPMTLLIASAMASCSIQFFSVFRLRLAK